MANSKTKRRRAQCRKDAIADSRNARGRHEIRGYLGEHLHRRWSLGTHWRTHNHKGCTTPVEVFAYHNI